jgi:hypothetical protein
MNRRKMRVRKNIIFFLVVLVLSILWSSLIVFSQQSQSSSSSSEEGGLTVIPSSLTGKKLPGDLLRENIKIENNLDRDIYVRIQKIVGNITEVLPSVDKVWTRIPPKESRYLQVKGFMKKDIKPGIYNGEIVLGYEEKTYTIPIQLTVIGGLEDVVVSLDIKPRKHEIKPGEFLSITTKIAILGEKPVDLQLELELVDTKTDEVVLKKTVNFTSIKKVERIIEVSTFPEINEGSYEIRGNIYHKEKEGFRELKASDKAKITIKKPIFEVFAPLTSLFTLGNIIFAFFIIITLILSSLLYRYYKEEKEKKRRYLQSILKSIKFETLPKSGPRSGFIGRIAETNIKAFFDIDQLRNHTLIAGATGTGKTVTAQIIAEEALSKGASLIVFDPTAQWTGFLRKNRDLRIFNLYREFGMKVSDARNFRGSVYVVKDPSKKIEIKKNIKAGEITIFCLHQLDSTQIEEFITNTIDEVYKETLEESSTLRALLVYDEIHRILPKFGGSSKGLTWLEKGAREFRKWGIGLILISQVLSDFVGEIKANIGTEIQLMTKYEEDLKRIRMKYGEAVHKSVVKAATGEGMIQNAEYNRGFPYFIRVRPPLHSLKRLEDETLEKYDSYTQKIDKLEEKIQEIRNKGVDVFDIEIELNLARENLKEGMFGVVDLYLETLVPNINQLYEKVQKGEIQREEEAIVSEWDIRKKRELEEYEKQVKGSIKEKKEKLEEKGEMLKKKKDEELKEMEKERKKLIEEEKRKEKELEKEKERLEKKSTVLDLLQRYRDLREILREDIVSREWKKIELQERKLKELEEPKLAQIKEEREKREEEMKRIIKEMKEEEERITQELKKVEEMWKRITEDEKGILDKDKEICNEEWQLIEKIKEEIKNEIEKRGRIKRELIEEEKKVREQEMRSEELGRKRRESRGEREEIKERKDKLYEEFKRVKEKWLAVLAKESEMRKEDEKIKQMEEELDKKRSERLREEELTEKRGSEEFKHFKEMVDELLGKLHKEDIEEFERSDEFKIYEQVMKADEVVDDEVKKEFIIIVDKLLEKLPEDEVQKFVDDKENYALYKRIVKRYKKEQ